MLRSEMIVIALISIHTDQRNSIAALFSRNEYEDGETSFTCLSNCGDHCSIQSLSKQAHANPKSVGASPAIPMEQTSSMWR
jgi:hypothetical protein